MTIEEKKQIFGDDPEVKTNLHNCCLIERSD